MKRLALGILVLALAGCQQTPPAAVGQLATPVAVAQVGRAMLVASLDGDELRALDLNPDPTKRQFLRAPNPLYPLSVPTAPWATQIASFTTPDGEATAPFAFTLSPSASLVSVVSADRLSLLGVVQAPAQTLAIATPPTSPGQPQLLVAAALQNGQGVLYTATLDPALLDNPSAVADLHFAPLLNLGRHVPQALAFSPLDANTLLVGDRLYEDAGGGKGGLMLVDLKAKTAAQFDVGGPVRMLQVDPLGEKVFGVIDPEGCADETPCSGVFGFDLRDRTPVPGPDAAPMEIPGTARTLAVGGPDVITVGESPVIFPLVLVASTNGSVYVVDGGRGALLDVDGAGASVLETFHLDPAGGRDADPNGPTDVTVAEGATRTERVTVTFEGRLPALRARKGSLSGQALTDTADFPAMGVVPGDLFVLENPAPACTTPEVAITAVARGSLTLGTLAAPCANGAVTYSVRARAAYVVAGSASGFMGRASANAPFEFKGHYFHRGADFGSGKPALAFKMGAGDPRRDARYVLSLASGVTPFAVAAPALGAASNPTILSMPTGMAWDPKLGRFYVAYSGGSTLVELNPSALANGSNTAGIVTFQ